MKYKHIQAGHELRMWIVQVIIPSAIAGTMYLETHPQTKENLKNKLVDAKWKVKDFFSKK